MIFLNDSLEEEENLRKDFPVNSQFLNRYGICPRHSKAVRIGSLKSLSKPQNIALVPLKVGGLSLVSAIILFP